MVAVTDAFIIRRSPGPGLTGGPLFVDRDFLAFQARAQGAELVTFIAQTQSGADVASLTFGGRQTLWTSPITGAFGGASGPEAPAEAIFALVEAATAWLRDERKGERATVRLPPDCLADPTAPALENALFRSSWTLAQVDLNYHLPVTTPEAFLAALGETKQKEVRRLKRRGAVVARLPQCDGRDAYAAIAENRAGRGIPMTMSWDQVSALAIAFPERVGFFVASRAAETLAGAICLDVTPAHRYVFYWGERPEFRRESPVTLLAEGLMAESHQRGFAVLDIGVSTNRSDPNLGLIRFKQDLGCLTTAKRTYALDLS